MRVFLRHPHNPSQSVPGDVDFDTYGWVNLTSLASGFAESLSESRMHDRVQAVRLRVKKAADELESVGHGHELRGGRLYVPSPFHFHPALLRSLLKPFDLRRPHFGPVVDGDQSSPNADAIAKISFWAQRADAWTATKSAPQQLSSSPPHAYAQIEPAPPPPQQHPLDLDAATMPVEDALMAACRVDTGIDVHMFDIRRMCSLMSLNFTAFLTGPYLDALPEDVVNAGTRDDWTRAPKCAARALALWGRSHGSAFAAESAMTALHTSADGTVRVAELAEALGTELGPVLTQSSARVSSAEVAQTILKRERPPDTHESVMQKQLERMQAEIDRLTVKVTRLANWAALAPSQL